MTYSSEVSSEVAVEGEKNNLLYSLSHWFLDLYYNHLTLPHLIQL